MCARFAALALTGLLLLAPMSARAHAILLESSPAANARALPGRVAFVLHFNSRIDALRSRLTLRQEGKADVVLAIAPDTAVDLLTANADLAEGAYVLRWQVLAVDGHITRGNLPFTVAP